MAIRAVFFDAAGTLIKPIRGVGESYATLAAKYGKSISAQDISDRFYVCFEKTPRLAFPGASQENIGELERDWWKNLVAAIFAPWAPFSRFEDYFEEIFSYFASPQAWALYPDARKTLLILKQRGLILDVISNFDSRLLSILDGLGVSSLFENVFVSSRVGYAKPDAQIFRAALDRHNLSPQEALHVGDSETHDLHGAGQAGLRAVLIDRRNEINFRDPERIESLTAIPGLLDANGS